MFVQVFLILLIKCILFLFITLHFLPKGYSSVPVLGEFDLKKYLTISSRDIHKFVIIHLRIHFLCFVSHSLLSSVNFFRIWEYTETKLLTKRITEAKKNLVHRFQVKILDYNLIVSGGLTAGNEINRLYAVVYLRTVVLFVSWELNFIFYHKYSMGYSCIHYWYRYTGNKCI